VAIGVNIVLNNRQQGAPPAQMSSVVAAVAPANSETVTGVEPATVPVQGGEQLLPIEEKLVELFGARRSTAPRR
jgi:hypothetical protein